MVEQLQAFFVTNDVVVQFVQGQVFLILGLAMALQWRQRSQLELARALPWLAAFGLLEALATWANGFIPLQARLLSPDTLQGLRLAQLLLILATFCALLGFGLKLSAPAVPAWAAWYVPVIVMIVVTALLLVQRALTRGPDDMRVASIEVFLRYFLGLSSALLVAFGLRQQAGRLVGPLKLERIIRALRLAGIGFILYAVVEGVLGPAAPFFPASVLNEMTLYRALGIPIGVWRALVGAMIVWCFFRALEVFRVEADRVAQALQREQSLNAERERISRELHDGTIQSIYAAGLVLDDARHSLTLLELPADRPEADRAMLGNARVRLDDVVTALNRTIQDIRTYIYDLRSNAAEEDLARGLIQIVTEYRLRANMQIEWSVDGRPTWTLSADQRQHVYQITREALSNIVRHAGASKASVELSYAACPDRRIEAPPASSGSADWQDERICLRIRDNGAGRLPGQRRTGHGLRNMQERARLLGAALSVEGTPGIGTLVMLEMRRGQA